MLNLDEQYDLRSLTNYSCETGLQISKTAKVFIERINQDYLTHIQKELSFVDMAAKIRTGDTAFIKPNLTFPHYREGVMTKP